MKIQRHTLSPGEAVSKMAARLDAELKEELPRVKSKRGRFEIYFNDGNTKTLLCTEEGSLGDMASGGVVNINFEIRCD